MKPENILERFDQMGYFFLGDLHVGLLSIGDGIFPYRAITFILFLISSLFLYSLLSKYEKIPQKFSLYFVLLIITLPFYGARITQICLPYTITYTLFILGCWCTVKYFSNKNLVYFILAPPLFFLSFFGLSTIFAYILPLGFVLYHTIYSKKDQLLSNAHKIIPCLFISLPVFFVIIKTFFFKSHGFYQIYNPISMDHIINIPKNLELFFFNNFFETIVKVSPVSVFQVLIIFAGAFFLNSSFKYLKTDEKDLSSTYLIRLIIFGFFCFFLAAFPYLLTGKLASFISWSSRHQLFIPFGMALIIVSLIYLLVPKSLKDVTLSLIIIACLVSTSINYIDYQRDWFKQESIIYQMRYDRQIENSSTIIFKDLIPEYNAEKRGYAFYEYNGWLKLIFGDEKRMGINKIEEINVIKPCISSELYNMGEYSKADPTISVTIKNGTYSIKKPLSVINLLLINYFNPSDYHSVISNVVEINTTLMNSSIIK